MCDDTHDRSESDISRLFFHLDIFKKINLTYVRLKYKPRRIQQWDDQKRLYDSFIIYKCNGYTIQVYTYYKGELIYGVYELFITRV